ncbi:hypothetical protein [Azospirillum rugosum]|uniref:Phage FluMu protein Com n=1 Tax=Azospirillum rugosum TaxID=416170 RepID=A0ABS4SX07_9PROT|nr:hypothetical protein [Azospirillum rugosum]MBP2297091.1 phage FluMu protein Com [Azospirillum rugosum]MDQ0530943.1 phage FluMu protein Com [Azospirillum rugosum]
METSRAVECGDCGEPLDPSNLTPGTTPIPCPKCGSTNQKVTLNIFDEITTEVRDSLKGKVKDDSFPSKKKVRRDFFYGSDERKSKGDYVYKEREIDKDNNRYRELVREESGEVIRDIEQPLTDHTGHGSAKFKNALTGGETEPNKPSQSNGQSGLLDEHEKK